MCGSLRTRGALTARSPDNVRNLRSSQLETPAVMCAALVSRIERAGIATVTVQHGEAAPFAAEVIDDGSRVIVHLSGEVGPLGAAELVGIGVASAGTVGVHALVLEMSRVASLDGAGRSALLLIREAAAERDVQLQLINVPDHVRSVLSDAELDAVFDLTEVDTGRC
jgi:anti-anti-sigma factor